MFHFLFVPLTLGWLSCLG
ncbi:hypothetical protein ACLK13_03890 [Escherichia coli]